jgi:predicted ATPase
MAPEHHDWTRHGAGRSLLWWPLSAFVLIAVFPDAGILPIVLSGAALALVGATGTVAARVLRRRIRARRAAGAEVVGSEVVGTVRETVSEMSDAVSGAVDEVVDGAVETVERVTERRAA